MSRSIRQISVREISVRTPWRVAGAVALMVLAAAPAAGQDHLPAGVDCWKTEPGSTAAFPGLDGGLLLNAAGSPSLPVEAQTIPVQGRPPVDCDCEPDPPIQWLDPHDNPVAAGDKHAVRKVGGDFDTCVNRLEPVWFSAGEDKVDVPIQLLELSLTGGPLPVAFADGSTSLFEVLIEEDGVSPLGAIGFTRTGPGPQGDVQLGTLPVSFKLVVQDLESGREGLTIAGLSTEFQGTEGVFLPFDKVPGISSWGVVLLAVLLLAFVTYWLRRRHAAD